MDSLKSQFLLDPGVVFLNHGSFGACPRPVFEEYQRWQRELERQPVEFLARRATDLLAGARAALAAYLGAAADDVVYFPNPTTAVNMVARSLRLGAGDEILTTDHEYGALDRTWRFICGKTGARYVRRAMTMPLTTSEDFVEAFWGGVTERTRVIFISHLTSPTALIFPVEAICRRARAAGILTLVDGAHIPGHLPLNLREVGADIYVGACHKWLMAPKGAAFLYARPEVQARLEPLVVSWGWESETPGPSPFIDFHEWQGTRDLSAFLTVPRAVRFQAEHGWEHVRDACHALASETRARVSALTRLGPLCPDSPAWFGQMATLPLPPVDGAALKARLYAEYRVEVPLVQWNDADFVRVSYQGYNARADMETLLQALADLLPQVRKT